MRLRERQERANDPKSFRPNAPRKQTSPPHLSAAAAPRVAPFQRRENHRESNRKGLRLISETDGKVLVSGDNLGLRQVFFNVLDNAIKYTPPGGNVKIQLNKNGKDAVATIHDTGIGIAAEHLPHVFDRFYRVDQARSRAEGGTGLGLSIAQSIVRSHGGRIELTSQSGQGSTCTVSLPEKSSSETVGS